MYGVEVLGVARTEAVENAVKLHRYCVLKLISTREECIAIAEQDVSVVRSNLKEAEEEEERAVLSDPPEQPDTISGLQQRCSYWEGKLDAALDRVYGMRTML